MISQNQYSVLRLPTRRLNIKIDLINEKDIIIGSFEGIATDGNVSLDGTSTYRRSGNLTMIFDKKYNLLPNPSSKIWFNKRIGIHIGLKNYFGEIVWFDIGRFAIDEADLNFDVNNKSISCQLKDYMAFLDGSLGGTIPNKIIIKEGTPINEAIKVSLSGLGRVSVEDMKVNNIDLKLPYTIEKESGSTVYELIKEIVDLYPNYDFYCDENGYYTVEKIRNKKNDPIIENFDGTERDLTISSSSQTNFKTVKNSIYIWGRQLDNGVQVKWCYRNRWARDGKADLTNLDEDKKNGDICFLRNENKSYSWKDDRWELLDFNVIPMFNIESIGEKIFTKSQENIFDNEQARLVAEYELEKHSNTSEDISFTCVPLYYLEPFQKIKVNVDNIIKGNYLIKSVSVPLDISSAMSVTANKIYEYE